ncbi:MAG TPA: hypothetical protein VE913_19070 [Longimicrobium sp.]|nr:hypothetical protein [Longimicrobium sp.]
MSMWLRPGLMHDLALSFRGFDGEGGGFRLPQSFGVEVAPLFLRRSFRREEYARNAVLSRLRLSLATRRGSEEGFATVLSFGARTSLVDRADLRTDTIYRNRILPLLDLIGALGDSMRFAGFQECPTNDFQCLSRPAETVRRLPNVSERRRELVARLWALRDSVVEAHWNAPVLDVAYAGRITARDSLGNDPSVTAHVGWASWGFPVGRWGQFVLGARAGYEENDSSGDWHSSLRGGGRLYAGSNSFKGFVEAGIGSTEDERWTAHGGAEVKVLNGVYAALSTGYEYAADGRGRLRARINLRTSPGNVVPGRADIAPADTTARPTRP